MLHNSPSSTQDKWQLTKKLFFSLYIHRYMQDNKFLTHLLVEIITSMLHIK